MPKGRQVPVKQNPTIRPSTITSQPSTSTGIPDLDKILLHLGLPLGSFLVVEESGTTDFASVISRSFASQGVVHSRLDKDIVHSHVIAVGVPPQWALELPGIYKGSTKEQKRAAVAANESKISVSNLAEPTSGRSNDMRIAWRYGLNKEKQQSSTEPENETFANQFDLTQKLNLKNSLATMNTVLDSGRNS